MTGVPDQTLEIVLDTLANIKSSEINPSFRDLAILAGLDPQRDFIGAYLPDLDFRDEDLAGFNFSKADLTGADFRRANLDGAIFTGAILIGAIGINVTTDEPLNIKDLFNLQQAKRLIVSGQVPPAEWWPNIKSLRLGASGIVKIDQLKNLHSLESLSLKSTRISNLSPFLTYNS